MADDNLMDQNEIEQLLNQAKSEATPDASEQPASEQPVAGGPPTEPLGQSDIESLLGGSGGDPQQSQAAEAPSAAQPQSQPPPAEDRPAAAAAVDDDEHKLLGQDDIEKLLDKAGTATPKAEPKAEARKEATPEAPAGESTMPQGDIEYLLNQAEQALESIGSAGDADLPQGVAAFRLEEFSGAPASTENATLDLIRDVELDLRIELGRTHMYIEDVLKLRKGSVVPLDKLAGDPVDIYVNGRLIARGEVLVLNDNFCVRVAELIAGANVYA